MKIQFKEQRFAPSSLKVIGWVNDILAQYRALGYKLSLRQLYYQLVSKDLIPNTLQEYKRIGGIVSDGRLAGLIDWDMIEDRNRETVHNSHWDSPAEIVQAAADSFMVDRWEGQTHYVEVMVEKDALSGILLPVCRGLDVRFTANKGYSSSSAMMEVGKRIAAHVQANETEEVHIIYLGDHDPSGIDMTRDITDRAKMFAGGVAPIGGEELEEIITIHRIALNHDQVLQWKPPKNPAKQTDSRFMQYRAQYGPNSWELDAIEPTRLAGLLQEMIASFIDRPQWKKIEAREKKMKNELKAFVKDYNDKGKK